MLSITSDTSCSICWLGVVAARCCFDRGAEIHMGCSLAVACVAAAFGAALTTM